MSSAVYCWKLVEICEVEYVRDGVTFHGRLKLREPNCMVATTFMNHQRWSLTIALEVFEIKVQKDISQHPICQVLKTWLHMLCYILTDRRAGLFSERRGRGGNWRGALTVFEKDVRTYLKHTHNTSCAITQTISIAYTYIMQYIIRWSNTRTLTLSRKCSRYTARLLN